MFRPLVLTVLAATMAAPLCAQEPIKVPSGQQITYVETIEDLHGPAGLTYRFRFLAPAIARPGGTMTAEVAVTDMAALCQTFALPRLPNPGPPVQEIVISLADRPVVFGAQAPDATQYFEAFRPEGNACIWEGY